MLPPTSFVNPPVRFLRALNENKRTPHNNLNSSIALVSDQETDIEMRRADNREYDQDICWAGSKSVKS